MISELSPEFRKCFKLLPERIRKLARKNYQLWKSNPQHPGIEFKIVGKNQPIYSIRVGIGWRALGLKQGRKMLWFWIGSHAEYDRILKNR